LITARLEPHVLNNVMPLIGEAMDSTLKENIVKALDLIGKGAIDQG